MACNHDHLYHKNADFGIGEKETQLQIGVLVFTKYVSNGWITIGETTTLFDIFIKLNIFTYQACIKFRISR